MKLNGIHQLLVYANVVNILGGSVHLGKGKRKFTLKQATKAHRGSTSIALPLLQPLEYVRPGNGHAFKFPWCTSVLFLDCLSHLNILPSMPWDI